MNRSKGRLVMARLDSKFFGRSLPDRQPEAIRQFPVTTLLWRLSLVSISILVLSAAIYAQSGNSTVRGTVRDPQGNVVAGATVNLTNPDKNFSRTQTTVSYTHLRAH